LTSVEFNSTCTNGFAMATSSRFNVQANVRSEKSMFKNIFLMVALCVGGMMLVRAAHDEPAADELRAASRRYALALPGLEPVARIGILRTGFLSSASILRRWRRRAP
jgi:hypothetical protein